MRIYISSLTLLFALIALPVHAATITLAPTTVSLKEGQTFTATVAVDPSSTKTYTVKSALSFPADMLSISSFAFGSGWMPLSAAGYDSTDNTNGQLIKTAGYTGGFTTTTVFGTVTFTAKKSGAATIAVLPTSVAYDAQNHNLLSGTQGSMMVSIASAVATTPASVTKSPTPSTPKKTTSTPSAPKKALVQAPTPAAVVATSSEATSTEEVLATTTTSDMESQAAAVATGSSPSTWMLILFGIVAFGAAVFYFLRR